MAPVIRKILFTSNLSETSKHAFSYALSLSERYNAKLIFLHVMEEPRNYVIEETRYYAKIFLEQVILDQSRDQASKEARATMIGKRLDFLKSRSSLKEFVNDTLKGHDNAIEPPGEDDIIIADGNIADIIIQTASERKCDSIVLGSRRRSALS